MKKSKSRMVVVVIVFGLVANVILSFNYKEETNGRTLQNLSLLYKYQ
ncbi:MAG: hypothetical protein ACTTJH_06320 [Bacteroidales bacterium]